MLVWITRVLQSLWRNAAASHESRARLARPRLFPALVPLEQRIERRPLRRRVIDV